MTGLRALVEADLAYTLEGDGAQTVVFIDPTGAKYPVQAMVIYDQRKVSISQTGDEVITYEMAITVRRSSLPRIPAANEKWGVLVPKDPTATAPQVLMALGPARAPEGGRSIGFIRFYPRETVQS